MDQEPTQPQPPVPPTRPDAPQPPTPGAYYATPPVHPGQTTGIIGLIFAFVGLAPVGLVLSIISTVKSAKSSTSKTLGVVGIVLNALAIIVLGFFFSVIIFAAYSGIQERAHDTATRTDAQVVASHAEAYFAENGSYPQTITDSDKYESSRLDSTPAVTTKGPSTTSEVQYRPCGITGAKVAYLSASSTIPVILYLGTGSTKTCQ